MALPSQRESWPRRVVRNPRILGGEPTLEGTRVPVRTVVEAVRYIGPVDEIVEAYPMLDRASVEAALAAREGAEVLKWSVAREGLVVREV